MSDLDLDLEILGLAQVMPPKQAQVVSPSVFKVSLLPGQSPWVWPTSSKNVAAVTVYGGIPATSPASVPSSVSTRMWRSSPTRPLFVRIKWSPATKLADSIIPNVESVSLGNSTMSMTRLRGDFIGKDVKGPNAPHKEGLSTGAAVGVGVGAGAVLCGGIGALLARKHHRGKGLLLGGLLVGPILGGIASGIYLAAKK